MTSWEASAIVQAQSLPQCSTAWMSETYDASETGLQCCQTKFEMVAVESFEVAAIESWAFLGNRV